MGEKNFGGYRDLFSHDISPLQIHQTKVRVFREEKTQERKGEKPHKNLS
jgi:hypothetical protein